MFNNFGKLLETRCWPTDGQTDRQTEMVAYRAAIAAKKSILEQESCQEINGIKIGPEMK